jgi:hypothetical protein
VPISNLYRAELLSMMKKISWSFLKLLPLLNKIWTP